MNLLVVGRYPQVPGFFQSLATQADQNVAFCSSGNEALDFCRRTISGIDWIFFAGVPQDELSKTLRQMRHEGISSPVILCQTPEPADAHAPLSPVLVSIYERSSQDRTLLGCNLVAMDTAREDRDASFTDEILFEYHAPCAAGKGR
jgi:hypothetical protein